MLTDSPILKGCMEASLNDETIWKHAEDIAERVLVGQNTADFDAFSADFTSGLREKLTRDIFLETVQRFRQNYGNYQRRRPLCILNSSECIPVLWILNFDRTEQDFLFQLRLVKRERQMQVESVLFRSWMV